METREEKIVRLKRKLAEYQDMLAFKMKRYRGVVHESAASEMKHQQVMVLRVMVTDLQREIKTLESERR